MGRVRESLVAGAVLLGGCAAETADSPATLPPVTAATTLAPRGTGVSGTTGPATTTLPLVEKCAPYEVKAGDSMFSIAIASGVRVEEIQAKNHLADINRLEIGQVLSLCRLVTVEEAAVPAVAAGTPIPETTLPPATTTTTPPGCHEQYFYHGGPSDPACITEIQNVLNSYNCNAGVVDGIFGKQVDYAARKFQRANGLVADGKIGPITWPMLAGPNNLCDASPVNNEDARLLCTTYKVKCILVQLVGDKYQLELYHESGVLVDSTVVNVGKPGSRTRNNLGTIITDETFPTEEAEFAGNSAPGVEAKSWPPGVRQIFDGDTGLMYDPHGIEGSGGQRFHGRVAYSGQHDEQGKSIPVLVDGQAQENPDYSGGFASNGCIHVPWGFLVVYDDVYFQPGVRVVIMDQPVD
jgi:LysM repeat protein